MIKLIGPFSKIDLSKRFGLLLLLSLILVVQALAVIHTKHDQRQLNAKLQANFSLSTQLQNEWSQLLLEQSTWQADMRVERIAREQLGMVIPRKVEVIVP